jgi:hypothetical protein
VAAGKEKEIEVEFSISDVWSRQLFVALCRRYGLRPFRYRRMHRQSIIIRAPKSFVEQVLWPEFEELSAALTSYLSEITERVIRKEVHCEHASWRSKSRLRLRLAQCKTGLGDTALRLCRDCLPSTVSFDALQLNPV